MPIAPPRPRRPRAPFLAALAAALLLVAGVPRAAHAVGGGVVRTVTTAVVGQGLVTSSPAGINCAGSGSGCSASFANDAVVTLSPTPVAGWAFLGWAGACSGTGTCTLPASASEQGVIATFGPMLTVLGSGSGGGSVTSSPAGIACVVVGGIATGNCSAAFPSGTVVTLTQSAGIGSTSGGCAPGCTVGVSTPTSITVVFNGSTSTGSASIVVSGIGTGAGTVSSAPGGIACAIAAGTTLGSGCTGSFPAGTSVTLTAAPGAGSTFTGWSGACSSLTTTCTVVAGGTGVQSVAAYFNAQATGVQLVTVTGQGSGNGTVTSTPGGIVCNVVNGVAASGGSTGTGEDGCSGGFATGTVVNLIATPRDDGSRFAGWSGACTGTSFICRITVSGPTTATATFTRSVVLTVGGVTSTGTGTVTSSPVGIACTLTAGTPSGTGCSAEFAPGTVVTLSATGAGSGTPGGPSAFTGWSGACTGTGTTCQVTLTQSTTVRASFTGSPAVVVRGSGTGSGRVTSNPSGIDCGVENGLTQPSSLGSTCRAAFSQGATVTLTAAPATGNVFLGWSGVTCAATAPGQAQGAAVCTLVLRDSVVAGAQFATLPAVASSTTDLLTGSGLSPAERSVLDQLGNGDGSYNLGDLLALLDRTGQRLSGDVMARLLALPAELSRPFTDDRTPRARTTSRRP